MTHARGIAVRACRFSRFALVCLLSVACTPWHSGPLPTPGDTSGVGPGRNVRTRVVLTGGRRVELRALSVRADSVVGYVGPTDEARWRFATPVGQVVAVERADFTTVRTTGKVIVVGYATLAVVGMAVAYLTFLTGLH